MNRFIYNGLANYRSFYRISNRLFSTNKPTIKSTTATATATAASPIVNKPNNNNNTANNATTTTTNTATVNKSQPVKPSAAPATRPSAPTTPSRTQSQSQSPSVPIPPPIDLPTDFNQAEFNMPPDEYNQYAVIPMANPPKYDELQSKIASVVDLDARNGSKMFPQYIRQELSVLAMKYILNILKTLHLNHQTYTAAQLDSLLFPYIITTGSRLAATVDEQITIIAPILPLLGESVAHPEFPEISTVIKRYFTNSGNQPSNNILVANQSDSSTTEPYSTDQYGNIHQLAILYRFDHSNTQYETRHPLTKSDVERFNLFDEKYQKKK